MSGLQTGAAFGALWFRGCSSALLCLAPHTRFAMQAIMKAMAQIPQSSEADEVKALSRRAREAEGTGAAA